MAECFWQDLERTEEDCGPVEIPIGDYYIYTPPGAQPTIEGAVHVADFTTADPDPPYDAWPTAYVELVAGSRYCFYNMDEGPANGFWEWVGPTEVSVGDSGSGPNARTPINGDFSYSAFPPF